MVILENIQHRIEEVVHLSHEEINILSYDGKKLFGRYYHTADNTPIQIMFHGYKSSGYLDFCGRVKFARKCDQNVLIIDQRFDIHTKIILSIDFNKKDCAFSYAIFFVFYSDFFNAVLNLIGFP